MLFLISYAYYTRSVDEAIQMVEDDDSIVNANNNNIYIQPLDDLQGIDNDSGDLDNVSIHNLPGSQLRAPFDIKVRSEDDFNKYIKRGKKCLLFIWMSLHRILGFSIESQLNTTQD